MIGSQPTARLELRAVSKSFDDRASSVDALEHIDVTVMDGEFVSIIGPSGCGKSTLLNIVAGLEDPSSGEILLNGQPEPQRLGRTAYMHQKDLLLPWRTVLDNAVLGLEVAGVQRRTARQRARSLIDRFGLRAFEDRYPALLSGGMRQRAAFLRTVLTERQLMLLDEPFGALDAFTRADMQEWLLGLWEELGRTIVFVTHDVDEAVLLSDRVLVMSPRPGRIVGNYSIDLPRPRRYQIVTDDRFVRLKTNLLADLRGRESPVAS